MVDMNSLDKRCRDILYYITLSPKKMGFNELEDSIKKANYSISRKTLSKHIKHLIDQKIIGEKQVGSQKVNYEIIDWHVDKSPSENNESNKIGEFIENHVNGREAFVSLPAEIQAKLVVLDIMVESLEQLEAYIFSILNPEKAFSHQLDLLVFSRIMGLYKSWIIEECKNNKKEFAEKVLKELVSTQEKFMNEISKFNC